MFLNFFKLRTTGKWPQEFGPGETKRKKYIQIHKKYTRKTIFFMFLHFFELRTTEKWPQELGDRLLIVRYSDSAR